MPRKKVQEPVSPEVQEDLKDALPTSADQTEPAAASAPQEEPTPTDGEDAASPHEEGQIEEMSKLLAEMDSGDPSGEDTPMPEDDDTPNPDEEIPPGTLLIEEPQPKRGRRKKAFVFKESEETPPPEIKPASPVRARVSRPDSVLTIEARGEVLSEEEREETLWHEIRNAYRSHRILTGPLSGVEQLGDGKSVAVVDYKGFRVIIPVKEMMLRIGRLPTGTEYAELMRRQNRILGSMLGAELDFVVKGIENKSRSVVASRQDAMLRKRKTFYLDVDESGLAYLVLHMPLFMP